MICMLYNTGKNIGGEFCEKISMGEDVCARVMSPQFLSVAAASRTQQEKIIIMIGGDAGGRSSIDHDSRRWTPLDATAGRPRSRGGPTWYSRVFIEYQLFYKKIKYI